MVLLKEMFSFAMEQGKSDFKPLLYSVIIQNKCLFIVCGVISKSDFIL